MTSLTAAAASVLQCADPFGKARQSRAMAAAWREGAIDQIGDTAPPERPARPARPELRPPREMPKRGRARSPAGRIALIHAVAHIELNAIDLAWDMIARFHDPALPRRFHDDWVLVADDEARHFLLLCERLRTMGARYGDLPAHDGLWEAAQSTAGDLLARLAVVPLVLEARGLDVTPPMIANLRDAGDDACADTLEIILREEIGHVATGRRWFEFLCGARGLDPVLTYQELVRRWFRGALKPPFNKEARNLAGFSAAYYAPLAGQP